MFTRMEDELNAKNNFREAAHRLSDECDENGIPLDGPDLLIALEEPTFITKPSGHIKRDLRKIALGVRKRDSAGFVDLSNPFSPINSRVLRPLNNCALLQLYYGDVVKARALTQHLLGLVCSFLRAGASDDWGIWVIPAQINIARLAALEGDCDEAISIYNSLVDLVTGRSDYRVEGVLVQKDLCSRTAFPDDIVGITIADSVQGSCKALLITKQYERLLRYMTDTERDERLRGFSWGTLFLECRARALAGLGRSTDAVELVHDALKDDRALQSDKAGLVALQAQFEASLGRKPNEALDVFERQLMQQSGENRPATWYLLYRCALVRLLQGEWARCETLLAPMHQIANSLGDQVAMLKTGAIEFAAHSTRASSTSNIEAALQRRFDWLGTVYYRLEAAVGFIQLASIAREMDGLTSLTEKCTAEAMTRGRSTSLCLAKQLAQCATFSVKEGSAAPASFTDPEIESLYDAVLHRSYTEAAAGS